MPPADNTDNPAQSAASEWSAVPRLLPFLWVWPARVIAAMAFLFAAKGASVLLPVALKEIVDTLDTDNLELVALPVGVLIAYGALRLASTLFGEIRDVIFGRVTEHAMREVALKVFKHLHALDLSFHLERRTGGLSRDIERGLNGINFLMRFMLFNILPTLLEIGLVAGILFVGYGWEYSAVTVAAVVGYIAFSVGATEWRTRFVREANKLDSRANTRAVDSLLNYETVKYFNNEAFEANNYDQSLQKWESALGKSRLSSATLNSGQAFIIAIAATLMLIMAASDVKNGAMTLGDLVLINAYILQLFMPLGFLGFVYREIKRSLADISRMFNLLDAEPRITDPENAPELKVKDAAIRFNNVHFGYHDERPILQGINLNIQAGQTVAIVGASGAGKSTIARLLFRFYDVNNGSIEIDGQDIRDVSWLSLRQHICVVPQDTVLFNDTLEYNLRYGRPGASDQELQQVIRMAHLSQFVDRLPDGLNTTVGERGLKLSGGEKQRVAIARALLKNPEILIFDEATSSLDSDSEKAVLAAIKEVAAERTTVVIAHRLSTIVEADQIIVLEQGAVTETGSHRELLQQSGRYAQLWQLQQSEA
jgi:ATP-binding cassette subfamily B protein